MSDVIERLKKRIEARKWKITDDAFVPELIGMQYANNMNDWCLEIIDEELAKEPQVPQWIPCSERMPDKPNPNLLFENKPLELYLVMERNAEYAFRAFWNGKSFTDGWRELDVIAWQQLPSVWKGENNVEK